MAGILFKNTQLLRLLKTINVFLIFILVFQQMVFSSGILTEKKSKKFCLSPLSSVKNVSVYAISRNNSNQQEQETFVNSNMLFKGFKNCLVLFKKFLARIIFAVFFIFGIQAFAFSQEYSSADMYNSMISREMNKTMSVDLLGERLVNDAFWQANEEIRSIARYNLKTLPGGSGVLLDIIRNKNIDQKLFLENLSWLIDEEGTEIISELFEYYLLKNNQQAIMNLSCSMADLLMKDNILNELQNSGQKNRLYTAELIAVYLQLNLNEISDFLKESLEESFFILIKDKALLKAVADNYQPSLKNNISSIFDFENNMFVVRNHGFKELADRSDSELLRRLNSSNLEGFDEKIATRKQGILNLLNRWQNNYERRWLKNALDAGISINNLTESSLLISSSDDYKSEKASALSYNLNSDHSGDALLSIDLNLLRSLYENDDFLSIYKCLLSTEKKIVARQALVYLSESTDYLIALISENNDYDQDVLEILGEYFSKTDISRENVVKYLKIIANKSVIYENNRSLKPLIVNLTDKLLQNLNFPAEWIDIEESAFWFQKMFETHDLRIKSLACIDYQIEKLKQQRIQAVFNSNKTAKELKLEAIREVIQSKSLMEFAQYFSHNQEARELLNGWEKENLLQKLRNFFNEKNKAGFSLLALIFIFAGSILASCFRKILPNLKKERKENEEESIDFSLLNILRGKGFLDKQQLEQLKRLEPAGFNFSQRVITLRKILRKIYLFMGIAQFGIILVPVLLGWFSLIPVWLNLVWAGVIIFSSVMEMIQQRFMSETEQKMEKQLSPLLKNIAKDFNIDTSEQPKAFHIATGEVNRWSVIQLFLTVISLTVMMSLLMPQYLLVFLPLLALSFLWIRRNVIKENGMSARQKEYLQAYYDLEKKQENILFAGREFNLTKEWQKVDVLRKSFLANALFFSGGLVTLVKVAIPLAGTLLGFPLIGFLISTYLHFLFGTNYFIRSISESHFHLKLMDKMVKKSNSMKNIIIGSRWENNDAKLSLNSGSISKIKIKNLKLQTEQDKELLTSASLSLSRDEVVLISGDSGTGKSSLAKIFASKLQPASGEVELITNDAAIEQVRSNKDFKLEDLSQAVIYHNLEDTVNSQSLNDILSDNNVDMKKWLETVRSFIPDFAEEFIQRPLSSFSNGEKRRIKLALVLYVSSSASFIILDEPFSGLDQKSIERIENYIQKWQKINNCGIIIIEHRDFTKENFITKEWFIDEGEIKEKSYSSKQRKPMLYKDNTNIENLVALFKKTVDLEEFKRLPYEQKCYHLAELFYSLASSLTTEAVDDFADKLKSDPEINTFFPEEIFKQKPVIKNIKEWRELTRKIYFGEDIKQQKLMVSFYKNEIETMLLKALQKKLKISDNYKVSGIKQLINHYMINEMWKKEGYSKDIAKSVFCENWVTFNSKKEILKKFKMLPKPANLRLLRRYNNYDSFKILLKFLKKKQDELEDIETLGEDKEFMQILSKEYEENPVKLRAALLRVFEDNILIEKVFKLLSGKEKIIEAPAVQKRSEIAKKIKNLIMVVVMVAGIFFAGFEVIKTFEPNNTDIAAKELIFENNTSVIESETNLIDDDFTEKMIQQSYSVSFDKSYGNITPLHSSLTGRIEYIHPGGNVNNGELILKIDSEFLNREYLSLSNKYDFLKKEFDERISPLYEKEHIAELEWLQAKSELEYVKLSIEALARRMQNSEIRARDNGYLEPVSDYENQVSSLVVKGEEIFKFSSMQESKITLFVTPMMFNKICRSDSVELEAGTQKLILDDWSVNTYKTSSEIIAIDINAAGLDIKDSVGYLNILITEGDNNSESEPFVSGRTSGYTNKYTWESSIDGEIQKVENSWHIANSPEVLNLRALQARLGFFEEKLSRFRNLYENQMISEAELDSLIYERDQLKIDADELKRGLSANFFQMKEGQLLVNENFQSGDYIAEEIPLVNYVNQDELLVEFIVSNEIVDKLNGEYVINIFGREYSGNLLRKENVPGSSESLLVLQVDCPDYLPADLPIQMKVPDKAQPVSNDPALLDAIDNAVDKNEANSKGFEFSSNHSMVESSVLNSFILIKAKNTKHFSWIYLFAIFLLSMFTINNNTVKKDQKPKRTFIRKNDVLDLLKWLEMRISEFKGNNIHAGLTEEVAIFKILKKHISENYIHDERLNFALSAIMNIWRNKGAKMHINSAEDYNKLKPLIKKKNISLLLVREGIINVNSITDDLLFAVEYTENREDKSRPSNLFAKLFQRAA